MLKSYNHNKLKEARCPECESTQDLVVWYKDDLSSGCSHTLRCGKCPPPTDCPWWEKCSYKPDWHDEPLGLKDYTVALSYSWRGQETVMGLCFACRKPCDMSKGYGHVYVPHDLWRDTPDERCAAVVFCPACYRVHQQCHEKFVTSPWLKFLLNQYWDDARGQVI